MNPQSGKLPSHFSNKNMGRILDIRQKVLSKRFISQNVPKLTIYQGQKKKDSAKLGEFVGFNSPDLLIFDNLDF